MAKIIITDGIIDLDKKIKLKQGDFVVLKNSNCQKKVFQVVSFRNHNSQYSGMTNFKDYCSLLDLATGNLAFNERCSRQTTVRRVLTHLLRLGTSSYEYNLSIPSAAYRGYDLHIIPSDTCSVSIEI